MKTLKNLVLNDGALITGAVQAVLALLSATVVTLTADQESAILAATSAALALVAAFLTSPFRVSALTGFSTALITLLIGFGVPHIQPGIIGAVNAAITVIATLLVSARTDSLAVVRARRPKPEPVPPASAPAPPAPPAPPAA